MGFSRIETCTGCAATQENSYGGGYVASVIHCSACGAEVWIPHTEQATRCKKCGSEPKPGGEPACNNCGGRDWIKPKGRENYYSRWD